MMPENGAFEIVQKAGSLLAPGQGTELPEFRVFRRFCQFRRIQPAIGVRRRYMNIRGGNNQNGQGFDIRQRVNLVSAPDPERTAALQKERNVRSKRSTDLERTVRRNFFPAQPQGPE